MSQIPSSRGPYTERRIGEQSTLVLLLVGNIEPPCGWRFALALDVGLARAYLVLRIAHSLVEAIVNTVIIRFTLYAAASIVLVVLTLRAVWAVLLA